MAAALRFSESRLYGKRTQLNWRSTICLAISESDLTLSPLFTSVSMWAPYLDVFKSATLCASSSPALSLLATCVTWLPLKDAHPTAY